MKNFSAVFILFLGICFPSVGSALEDWESPFGSVPTVSKKESELLRAAKAAESDESALKILEAARGGDSCGAGLLFNLGNLHYRLSDYTSAVTAYSEALQKAPSFFMARKNLAFSFDALGDKRAAFENMRRALALSGGSDVDILLWLSSYYAQKGDFSAALACCNQAALYAPDSRSAKFNKAVFLFNLGLFAEADRVCAEMLSENIFDAEALKLLARARAASGDTGGAISALEILREAGLSDKSSSEFLAALSFGKRLYSRAAQYFAESGASENTVQCALAAFRCGDFETVFKITGTCGKKSAAEQVSAMALCSVGDFRKAYDIFKNASDSPLAAAFDADTKFASEREFYFARACAESGKTDEALLHYREAGKSDTFRRAALYGELAVFVAKEDYFNSLKKAHAIYAAYSSREMKIYIDFLEKKIYEMEKSAR